MSRGKLEGRSILLVEDEFFQAMDAKVWLEQAGARVIGPTGFADAVPGLLEREHIDAAVIDINLGRGSDYRVAEVLQQKGVPFVFLTGYDPEHIPEDLANIPRLQKPANERRVIEMIDGLFSSSDDGA